MTILDTFYLLFKSDAPQTAQDLKALEKQIDSLTTKGRKRTDEESKQLLAAKKQLKEITEEFKEQGKAVEGLKGSFVGLLEGVVGAVTAFVGFSALKTGVLDMAKLNSALFINQQITGQNAGELRTWATAVEAAGGSAQGFLGTIQSWTTEAARAGQPLEHVGKLLRYIHDQLQGQPAQEQRRILGLYGIADPGMIALLEQSNDDFEKSIELAERHAAATNGATKASREFEQQLSRTGAAWDDYLSRLGKHVLPPVTSVLGAGQTMLEHDFGVGESPARGQSWWDFLFSPLNSPASKTTKTTAGPMENESYKFWLSEGYSPTQAAALVGNAKGEGWNGGNVGDNGTAFGLAQWHGKRISDIFANTGVDVRGAGLGDQLRAQAWEMRSRYGITPESLPQDPSAATDFLVRHYEFSKNQGEDAARRGQYAQDIFNAQNAIAPAASVGLGLSTGAGASSVKNLNIKIDDINVHTQATDAQSISREIHSSLMREIDNALASIDDGVLK